MVETVSDLPHFGRIVDAFDHKAADAHPEGEDQQHLQCVEKNQNNGGNEKENCHADYLGVFGDVSTFKITLSFSCFPFKFFVLSLL